MWEWALVRVTSRSTSRACPCCASRSRRLVVPRSFRMRGWWLPIPARLPAHKAVGAGMGPWRRRAVLFRATVTMSTSPSSWWIRRPGSTSLVAANWGAPELGTIEVADASQRASFRLGLRRGRGACSHRCGVLGVLGSWLQTQFVLRWRGPDGRLLGDRLFHGSPGPGYG